MLTAAAFAQHNMPLGTTLDTPALNDDDAYDVAGYINSKERPVKPDLAKDFPFKLQKSADTPYGPYVDGFDQQQHKFGPFGPIRAKIREMQEAAAAARCGSGEQVEFEAPVPPACLPACAAGGEQRIAAAVARMSAATCGS